MLGNKSFLSLSALLLGRTEGDCRLQGTGFMVLTSPRRLGCPVPQGMPRMCHVVRMKPITLQLESAGTQPGGHRSCEHQPLPKKPGSPFLPHRHPLAGHQTVLKGWPRRRIGWPRLTLSGGFPALFLLCVPATRLGLPGRHKAPAIYYSAAAVYVGVQSRPVRWASVRAHPGDTAVNHPLPATRVRADGWRKPPGGAGVQ